MFDRKIWNCKYLASIYCRNAWVTPLLKCTFISINHLVVSICPSMLRINVVYAWHYFWIINNSCHAVKLLTSLLNNSLNLITSKVCSIAIPTNHLRASFWFAEYEITFYFHVNGSIGIVQKIDFEIRPDLGCTTPKTSRKVVLDNPYVCVCLSVCLTVCLSCCRFSRELSQA